MTATSNITGSRMPALLELGQSIWLDYLRRGMLRSGELAGLIAAGLRGMTSNPTIFEQAIGGSTDYDDDLARLAGLEPLRRRDLRVDRGRGRAGAPPTSSARSTTDSNGADGFVSLEVSPGARARHERHHRRGGAALAGGRPGRTS